jgi:hypothetical protein
MPSPSNWEKKDEQEWHNDSVNGKTMKLEIYYGGTIGEKRDSWKVDIGRVPGEGVEHIVGEEDTKSEAMEVAMTWMRGHPHGFIEPYWKKTLAHGVGGSHTRWQGKPPAHVQYQFETALGTLRADFYSRDGETIVDVITQKGSDVMFDALPPQEQDLVSEIAQTLMKHDDFFSD